MRSPFTEYRPLHSATGVLAEAVAALPGYADADAAFRRCEEQLTAYLRTLTAPGHDAAVAKVVAALESGKPLPRTLPGDVWQALHSRDANVALEGVFQQVLQAFSGRRDGVIDRGRDTLMQHLDREVRSGVDEARTLELKGATSADAAIDAGVGQAWGRMRTLRERYRAIRAAQRTVVRTAYSNDGYDLDGFGFLENYAELVPDWAELKRGRTTIVQGDHTEVVGAGRYPWLPDVRSMLDEDVTDDDALRFDWLVATPEAVPWVPAPAQLREAAKRASDALNAHRPKPDPRPEVQLRRLMRSAKIEHEATQPLRDGADFAIGREL